MPKSFGGPAIPLLPCCMPRGPASLAQDDMDRRWSQTAISLCDKLSNSLGRLKTNFKFSSAAMLLRCPWVFCLCNDRFCMQWNQQLH